MTIARQLFFILLMGLVTTSCSSSQIRLGGPAGIRAVDASELPGPNGQVGDDQQYIYRIGPYDKLTIDVMGFQEMQGRRVQVDGSGNISVPIAGVVNVQGATLQEAVERVTTRLRQGYVRDPQVAINLEESLSQYVTVDGEVEQPGNYPIVAEMTMMRAVAAARGATDLARLRDVVIHRRVQGQQMVALYNLDAIRRGAYPDPVVYPQDTIVVGDSASRRLFQQIIQVVPLFLTPVVALVDNP